MFFNYWLDRSSLPLFTQTIICFIIQIVNIYLATGFNKWGMTNSMAAAKIFAAMINGKQNDYAEVFSPQRSILHPQLAINIVETFVNFITPTVPRCPHLG